PYAQMPGVERKLLSLDLFTAAHLTNAPVFVYIHGGAWVGGDKSGGLIDIRPQLSAFFVARGFVVASINYRLAPAVKHPAQVQDAARAVAWIHDNAARYGGNPAKLFICGHSAGAHMASLLATDERWLKEAGKDVSILRGIISLDTAAHDLVPTARFAGRGGRATAFELAFGSDLAVLRDASPLHHIAAGKRIPPHMLVFAADMPPGSVNKDKREAAMAEALRQAGTRAEVYAASFHSHYTVMADLGHEGDPVAAVMMTFMQSVLNNAAINPPLGTQHILKPDESSARRREDIAVRSVQRLLQLLDKDRDAAVSRAEAQSVPGGYARYFPEFDKNGDGRITVEEQRK
ncbi:MAG: alpha/beta hydrolase fold domain-containing protein, partial [Verrucomicrobia bacterium]|nr:alpha/beta hydrolase fold domain-containing protein [Verrucomicrobiota bacterium]